MAEAKDSSTDKLVYGVALGLALLAAGLAIANGLSGGDDAAADPVAAARARAEREARETSIELPAARSGPIPDAPPPGAVDPADTASARPLPPGFVPSLPEVPDLAARPPPARVEGDDDDPRMANLAAEMRMLSRARTLLGEHPAEALGVIRQHRRAYPEGALREEREVFAIEALLALEHTAEAERRYYDFLVDFPDSEHREHLMREMQRPPHAVGAGGR